MKVYISGISTKTVSGHFFEKMANAFSLIWINGPIIRFGSGIIVSYDVFAPPFYAYPRIIALFSLRWTQ